MTGILNKARKILKSMGYIELQPLQDDLSYFCIEYPKFYLTAKEYLLHDNVLCVQKEIFLRALDRKKQLMIFIEENNKFYLSDPEEVFHNYYPSKRVYKNRIGEDVEITMYNWDINLGREFLT